MTGMLVGTIAMMGSFGPVTALASLSNNLNQTLASGERVLSLLEEEPQVEEVSGKDVAEFTKAAAEHVDFTYDTEQILKIILWKSRRGRSSASWGKRLRKIDFAEIADAVLGCAGR